jgi:hypothetical protein
MMTQSALNPPVLVAASAVAAPAEGTSIAVSKPSGVVAGDVMVALVAGDSDDGWTAPSGWTAVLTAQNCIAWKVAGGSEGSSYTFNSDRPKSDGEFSGVIVAYRHCVLDTVGTLGTGSAGAACVAPGISLSALGVLLGLFASGGGGLFTTPDGMIQIVNYAGSGRPGIAVFAQQMSAGATGTRQSTPGNLGASSGILMALKGL